MNLENHEWNYPAFANALLNRHIAYNKTIDRILELEKQGKIFVIRPETPLNIGRMEKDPANVKRVYNIGYADGIKQMDKLKEWSQGKTDERGYPKCR